MKLSSSFLALMVVAFLAGCASSNQPHLDRIQRATAGNSSAGGTAQAGQAPAAGSGAQPASVPAEPPKPQEGEAAVFGRVVVTETINRVTMPAPDTSGYIYIHDTASDKTYEVRCSAAGDFGAYLPAGQYRIARVDEASYSFDTDIALTVPTGRQAVYAGTLELDGTPSGTVPDSGDTKFVYTVKDEYKDFIAEAKKKRPDVEELISKSLFAPKGGVVTGSYPNHVHRAKDVKTYLQGRAGAMEEVAKGTLIVIEYILNPLWIFAVP